MTITAHINSRRELRHLAFAFLLLTISCTDQPMTNPADVPIRGAQAVMNMTPGERAAHRDQVIEAIGRKGSPEQKAQLRQMLGSRSINNIEAMSPDVAPLVAELKAIRQADLAEEARNTRPAMPELDLVGVTVALVDDLDGQSRAVVLRQPNDGGVPVVLLNKTSATDADLEAGLSMAAASIETLGKTPSKNHRIPLHATKHGKGQDDVSDPQRKNKKIDLIRRAGIIDVPGIGRAQALYVMTPRKQTPSK